MTPKVSVVMPSYNHAPYVRVAVESVLAQSFAELELVITDDGSVDGTPDIIRSIADPRIRLNVLPENRGACVAMNDAISRAHGTYISVLNSDDYFLPGKIARQFAFLGAHPEIGAVFGLPRFIDEHGFQLSHGGHGFAELFAAVNRPRRGWLRHFFAQGNCLCHPTAMVRRSCYDTVGFFDPLLRQLPDFDLWVRICMRFDIHIIPEQLTAFRVLGCERNVSAPAPATAARSAWELVTVLERYAELPGQEIREIFSDLPGISEMSMPVLALALEALRIGRPGYRQFGLGLLRQCMRDCPGVFSNAEYFRLVGENDPYAVRFSGRLFEHVIRSPLFTAGQRAANWLRPYFRRGH
ncbi:MAG TPA: glycosyltransferase [Opitutaceae bacterium]|nr:glycosyltransferase [Opitutaceae bacterium]